jgi:hypothetical protein
VPILGYMASKYIVLISHVLRDVDVGRKCQGTAHVWLALSCVKYI